MSNLSMTKFENFNSIISCLTQTYLYDKIQMSLQVGNNEPEVYDADDDDSSDCSSDQYSSNDDN